MESGSNVTDGSNAETDHVIATTIHGRNGLPKQVRVVFLPMFVHETYPANNDMVCETVGHIYC
jgi:hypothetical protein